MMYGPSGCGKSSSIAVLARERNLHLITWNNPRDYSAFPSSDDRDRYSVQGNSLIAEGSTWLIADLTTSDGIDVPRYVSKIRNFEAFLSKACL